MPTVFQEANKMSRPEFEQELRVEALKDMSFRQRLLNNPKEVFEEKLGSSLPKDANVTIYEESPNTLYLVIPPVLTKDEELTDDQLEMIAGGGFAEDFWTGFKSGFFTLTACTPNIL